MRCALVVLSLLDMDDLATRAGEESANVIGDWVRTGKL